MKQKRQNARSRVLKGAKIILGPSSLFDCVVRDLTNTGARIMIPSTVDIPDRFALTFDGNRSARECRVSWRSLNETGVEFLDALTRQSAA